MQRPTHIDRYEIIDTIGSGDWGTVFKCLDTRLKRNVAIKVLNRSDMSEQKEIFAREANLVASVEHPNVVSILDLGEDNRWGPYMVMEYIPHNLASLLKSEGKLEQNKVIEYAIKIASGLSALHTSENKIIHRDIKSNNILLNEHGEPKVADFGLAFNLDGTYTRGTAIGGTFPYMAPEIFEKGGADERSDIYSLGVLIHEMLTGGEYPVKAPSPAGEYQWGLAHVGINPVTIKGISRGFSLLIKKTLFKVPKDRFKTMCELKEALQSLKIYKETTVKSTTTKLTNRKPDLAKSPNPNPTPNRQKQHFPSLTSNPPPRDKLRVGRDINTGYTFGLTGPWLVVIIAVILAFMALIIGLLR